MVKWLTFRVPPGTIGNHVSRCSESSWSFPLLEWKFQVALMCCQRVVEGEMGWEMGQSTIRSPAFRYCATTFSAVFLAL